MAFPLVAAIVAAVLYANGARRSRRPWPRWRTASFFAGLFAMLAALSGLVESYAYELFSVHMVQHLLLTLAAAPLLCLAAPLRPLLRGLPRPLRAALRPLARSRLLRTFLHVLRSPLVTGALYVGGLYYWHIPRIYDAAVADPALHLVEHAWFFGTALLFWSVIIDPLPFRSPLSFAPRIVYLLLAGAAQNTILGGVLSFSTRQLYLHYASSPLQYGVDPVTDQRLGGVIMWVPGDAIFLAAASACFFAFLRQEEAEQRVREAGR